MPVLTGIDILGIQSYVFASNRLRDVLAASWMVDHITNRASLERWGLSPQRVLVATGGNAIVEFDSENEAKDWTAFFSRWLLQTAPGLEATIAHRPYQTRPLAWALKALQVDLARAKLERRPSVPQLGLSVTASCSVTGLPATSLDHGELVSPRVECLRENASAARERWGEFLPGLEHALGWTPEFPSEFDLMGRTRGETSLIGVVHVDGNNIGRAIKDWLEHCMRNRIDDETVRTQYRAWSDALNELGSQVLHAVAKRTAGSIHEEDRSCFLRGTPHDLGFRLHCSRDDQTRSTGQNKVFLPLRPILLGGDDLTFVCDGRIALDLAVTAVKEFEEHRIPHLGNNGQVTTLTACAGAALAKAHAPFDRSYELAEALCRSAKRTRTNANATAGVETGGWIDWHVGTSRPGEPVDHLREHQYRGDCRDLSMRPYPLAPLANRSECWAWLDTEFLGPGDSSSTAEQGFRGADCWLGSHSRVKLLATLVPRGADEIERQLNAWKAVDSRVRLPGGLVDSAQVGTATPVLDAVELLDLHVRLAPDPRAIADVVAPAAWDGDS
jgi:hypothetical protein